MTYTTAKLVRFIVIGSACAVLFFAVNYYLLNVVGLSTLPALLLTYMVCFFIGYSLQRRFAFRSTVSHGRSLPRYFLLHCGGMIFVYLMTIWLKPLVYLGDFGAPLIATGLSGIASFVISITWVFSTPPESAGDAERSEAL